jgi:deazaflavin-dependent oxidoreductase (nitroreductase family)
VPDFLEPTPLERLFNRVFGWLVGLGLGLRHNFLLEVRGRRTGRLRATPVNVLELEGKRFLVAGRGRTQWVLNVELSGEVYLRKGRHRERCRVRPVEHDDKPAILSAYLVRFRPTVQRYFTVPAGSPPAAFIAVADRYPVFELLAAA